MKIGLPENHKLSPDVLHNVNLVPKDGDEPYLTDVQYQALDLGVARGESMLVVAPTATGKTLIAIWALIASVKRGCTSVYLVTHRALAKQKFEEMKGELLETYLGASPDAIVLATGDGIVDASGNPPSDPLLSPVMVATYEKYLAMLSTGGHRRDMSSTTIVCDELQLLGDQTRGQDTEILLTLLKRAGWNQFVGLSAVIEQQDAVEIADWLSIHLLRVILREKRLIYECRTNTAIYRADTALEDAEPTQEACTGQSLETLDIVREFQADKSRLPIIVFCMHVPETYKLASSFGIERKTVEPGETLPLFGPDPETQTEQTLATHMPKRIAVHSADLSEAEREIVEGSLVEGKLDVVFATSTLAAGVNFHFGTAVFHNWMRWNPEKRQRIPIDSSEFHNMAGRSGRMGSVHEYGHVIFTARNPLELINCQRYLNFTSFTPIEPRIQESTFERLLLQLAASGICRNEEDTYRFFRSTLSAQREANEEQGELPHWRGSIRSVTRKLIEMGMLI